MTQTVPDISPLMPMHQDPLLVTSLVNTRTEYQNTPRPTQNCVWQQAITWTNDGREYINCYPLFMVRSWNNGMRCMFLYILLNKPCKKAGQFAMPETCENWLGLLNSCVYCAHPTCEIYQVLHYSVDFKAPRELWNPLSKTGFSKCSFIWNTGPGNIWNDRKAQR